MDAALFSKPQGSGPRAHRKSPNGSASGRHLVGAAAMSPSRAARGSSGWERSASTAEAYYEDRGILPVMIPRPQLDATVSTLAKELYGCDGPQTFELQKELWRMRREEEKLQEKLAEVRVTPVKLFSIRAAKIPPSPSPALPTPPSL